MTKINEITKINKITKRLKEVERLLEEIEVLDMGDAVYDEIELLSKEEQDELRSLCAEMPISVLESIQNTIDRIQATSPLDEGINYYNGVLNQLNKIKK